MDFFQYQHHQLMAENLPVKQLAEQFGTPLYIYSKATLERHWHAFDKAFGEHPHADAREAGVLQACIGKRPRSDVSSHRDHRQRQQRG